MTRILAALLAALVATPHQDKDKDKPFDSRLAALAQDKQDKPLPPSEEFVEIKWDVQKDDRFDFKWSYDELLRIIRPPLPRTGGATVDENTENSDKREVIGEISLKEGENGQPGTIVLEIKKALWAVTSRDHEITLTMMAGKKSDLQQKIKGDPKATAASKEGLKTQTNLIAENMRKNFEGDFTVVYDTRRNNTSISLNNRPCKPGPSLFDRLFLQSPIPNSLIRQGQTWKEPIDSTIMPTGLMEAKDIDYKASQVTALNAVFKAGFQIPIVKPPSVTDQKISGSFTIAREFIWNRAGYLQSSKEDVSFTKKVDASGANAAFYKEDYNASVKQQLSIKKKPPPQKPDDKKDGEKKTDEKKPEEKKPADKK